MKLAYYKHYFQISETEVLGRLRSAIVPPLSDSFIADSRSNPDFYGPFWLLATLALLLGSVGNFSNYLLSKFTSAPAYEHYFFQLELMRYAVVLLASFGLGVPVTLHYLLRFLSQKYELELPQVHVCLCRSFVSMDTAWAASYLPWPSASSPSIFCTGPPCSTDWAAPQCFCG